MNILTDEEIKKVHDADLYLDYHDIARAIEAAVLSKLAEQDLEPVARLLHRIDGDLDKTVARTYNECSENLYPDSWLEGEKLYTETQLLAAQQRTAEACAKVCEAVRAEDGDGQHRAWYAGFDMCIDAIRNGEWREYL